MLTEFDKWFKEVYGEIDGNEGGMIYSYAKKAWDEAMNRGAKYATDS